MCLQRDEWALLDELLKVFKVFVRPSKELQGQTYVTNSFTLLYVYQIHSKLNELSKGYSSRISDPVFEGLYTAVQSGRRKLGKYFPAKLTSSTLRNYKPFILSHVLDPRFKLSHFKDGKRVLSFYPLIEEDVKKLLVEEFTKLKREQLGIREPLGADSANLLLSFNELGDNYHTKEVQL